MEPSHDISISTLCEYFVDRLDRESSQVVEAHLGSCLMCRELLKTMALLSGAPPEEVTSTESGHPLMEELVGYYRDPSSLPPETRGRLDAHMRECAECASEIEFLEELEREFTRASQ